jgi:hypothetical protein
MQQEAIMKPKVKLKVKLKIIEKFGGQWKFAAAIGEHESVVSKVMCGRRPLSEDKQRIWSKALGCKSEELFN